MPHKSKFCIASSTAQNYRSYVRKHFSKYFSNKGISIYDLQPWHIEDFYEDRLINGNIGPNSVCHLHSVLSGCYTLASRKLRINLPNIMICVEKPKFSRKQIATLSPQEADSFMNFLFEKQSLLYVPALLAYCYGLRRSEVCGLTWENIDFVNDKIYVNHRMIIELSCQENCKLQYTLVKGTKSDTDTHSYILTTEIKKQLLQIKQNQFKDNVVSNLVFLLPSGRALLPDYLTKLHRQEFSNLNLPSIRFHDLRHSCATNGARIFVDTDSSLFKAQGFINYSKLYPHVTNKAIGNDCMYAKRIVANLILLDWP